MRQLAVDRDSDPRLGFRLLYLLFDNLLSSQRSGHADPICVWNLRNSLYSRKLSKLRVLLGSSCGHCFVCTKRSVTPFVVIILLSCDIQLTTVTASKTISPISQSSLLDVVNHNVSNHQFFYHVLFKYHNKTRSAPYHATPFSNSLKLVRTS